MVVGLFQCRRPWRLPVPHQTTARQLVFLFFCGHNLVSEQRTYSSALDSGPGRGCVCLGCCGFMQMLVISVCDWISLLRLPQITTDLWWLTATESYPLTVLEVSPKSRGRLGHDPPKALKANPSLPFLSSGSRRPRAHPIAASVFTQPLSLCLSLNRLLLSLKDNSHP